jgi:hypothetical protein
MVLGQRSGANKINLAQVNDEAPRIDAIARLTVSKTRTRTPTETIRASSSGNNNGAPTERGSSDACEVRGIRRGDGKAKVGKSWHLPTITLTTRVENLQAVTCVKVLATNRIDAASLAADARAILGKQRPYKDQRTSVCAE